MPRTVALAASQIRLRRIDGRLLHGDGVLKRLLVQFNEKISLVHPVVVVHQNAGDLTADAGGDERHVAVHEGVVGRNRVEHEPDPGNAIHRSRDNHSAEHTDQKFFPPCEPLISAVVGSTLDLSVVIRRHDRPQHPPWV